VSGVISVVALPTADDTRALGARIAGMVRSGDLIVLDGPLGAGKTVFVQGLAAGLGASGRVTSPTFVIARVHDGGRLPLVHVDAYRLTGRLEVDDLDLDTELTDLDGAVVAVEWGAGLVEGLTDAHLRVQLVRGEGGEGSEGGEGQRTAVLHPSGGDWAERLASAGFAVRAS
jgi:tRNA threonylcarbamoyladenosine biosynthesis protein TsaE